MSGPPEVREREELTILFSKKNKIGTTKSTIEWLEGQVARVRVE